MKSIKALIYIGGSCLQLPGIMYAKELGIYVIVTDRNPNAPGKTISDQFEVISGTDITGLIDLAKRVKKDYDLIGAYASSDFGLMSVAEIFEELKLKHCSKNIVRLALDKFASKAIWENKKLPTPKGYVIDNYESLNLTIDSLGLPVIIKPIDSCGSQGVKIVENIIDLNCAFEGAKKYSSSIIVEELVCGKHIDVNGLFIEGKFYGCGVMERFFSDYPYRYPIFGIQPSSLSKEQELQAYDLVERAAREIGINIGPIKADLIWTNTGPIIIEVTPRFHGDVGTSYMTPLAVGVSPIKVWLAYLMGMLNPSIHLGTKKEKFAGWTGIFSQESGRLISIEGIQLARNVEGVEDIYIAVSNGDIVEKPKDNSSICGFIWATAESHEELLKILTLSKSKIHLVTEQL